MGLYYSAARQTGRRGAGLGNEIFAWAKAYLAAQELGLELVNPPWFLSRYGYHRLLPRQASSSVLTHGRVYAQRRLLVTESMYRSLGHIDYGLAMRALGERLADGAPECRGVRTLEHHGMFGGLP